MKTPDQQSKAAAEGPVAPSEQAGSPTSDQLRSHPAGAIAGGAAGAAAGAVSGIAAGPVGSLAGAVVGGITGAVLGSGSTSAAAGTPVQPGSLDDEAAAAAPSIRRPGVDAADKSRND